MGPLDALILGLVEGITEYLPVSSTGHLVIVAALLGLDEPPETKRAVDAFSIVIQGGAILAVLGLYRRRVWQMLRGLVGQDAAGRRLATNLFVAFLPAAFLGVLLLSSLASCQGLKKKGSARPGVASSRSSTGASVIGFATRVIAFTGRHTSTHPPGSSAPPSGSIAANARALGSGPTCDTSSANPASATAST